MLFFFFLIYFSLSLPSRHSEAVLDGKERDWMAVSRNDDGLEKICRLREREGFGEEGTDAIDC